MSTDTSIMTTPSGSIDVAKCPYSLPLVLEQPDIWPFDLMIKDADGYEVLSQGRYCYSSKDKTVSDVMEARSFRADERDHALFCNAEQVERLNFIVTTVNERQALIDRIEVLERALNDISANPTQRVFVHGGKVYLYRTTRHPYGSGDLLQFVGSHDLARTTLSGDTL